MRLLEETKLSSKSEIPLKVYEARSGDAGNDIHNLQEDTYIYCAGEGLDAIDSQTRQKSWKVTISFIKYHTR